MDKNCFLGMKCRPPWPKNITQCTEKHSPFSRPAVHVALPSSSALQGKWCCLLRFLVLPGGAPTPLPTGSAGRFLGLLTPPTPPRLPTGSLKLVWGRFPVP